MTRRAVALLSGGMDSAVAAAWARREEEYALVTLAVDYGQRHRAELAASQAISDWLGADEHVVLGIDLRPVGGSALTSDAEVPKGETAQGIPSTYVPARNTFLLSLALGLAETRSAEGIVIGVNRIDYSGYPDCRPEFLAAFQQVADLGTRAGVSGGAPRLLAPLVDHSKRAIVELGLRWGVPFDRTVSCYDATSDGRACGLCDACRLRRDGFVAAGVPDPTRYA